jgi:cytoskeleton protein RodZ
LVWLGLRGGLDNQLTRIAPLDHAPAANATTRVAQAIRTPAKSGQEQPLMASMTPFPAMNLEAATAQAPASQPAKPPAAPAVARGTDHVLTLDAHGDSWIEVTDASGRTLESGMLHAGETRSYHSSAALSVTLGNADAVAVQSDGKPLSLDAYRRANVARFKVFTSGPSNG